MGVTAGIVLHNLPPLPSFFTLTPDLVWCFPGSLNKEIGPVAEAKGNLTITETLTVPSQHLGQGSALQQSCGQTIT